MANVSSYPLATPKKSDLILITQTYDDSETNPVIGNPTKSAKISDVTDLVTELKLGYTSYTANFIQSQDNDPIVTDMYNNTGATFTWTRTGVGEYTITASSEVTLSNAKTFLNIQGSSYTSPPQNDAVIIQPQGFLDSTVNTIKYRSIKTNDASLTDDNAGWLEIRLYS